MKKKLLIIVEDDFEVLGNGLGNVADLQYLPALSLMNIAEELGIKLTFMVDVAHLLTLNKYQQADPNMRIQKKIWDETVLMMKERGFDVQLHLHPQWLNASYKMGYFYLNDNWNIGCYEPSAQRKLIRESIEYLTTLLRQADSSYSVIAFKAGSWGLQPSDSLLSELMNSGIRLVVGVRHGLEISEASVDYSQLEEKHLPYHPQFSDINKVAPSRNSMVILPLQPYSPNLFTLFRLSVHEIMSRMRYKTNLPFYHYKKIPNNIKALSPLSGMNNIKFSTHPYLTHLKIGDQPFSYLKNSFDVVIRNLLTLGTDRIPVVIESHTKQYPNYYEHVKRFLTYIAECYGDQAEFIDMTGFLKEVELNQNIVRTKNEN